MVLTVKHKHARRLLFPLGVVDSTCAAWRRQTAHLCKFHTVYIIKHAQFTMSSHFRSAIINDYLDLHSLGVVC